jgi:hypothetical protein
MGIIADIFSGLWQGFLAIFRMSDAQKLGRAEVTSTVLTNDLKEKIHEAEVFEAQIALSLLSLTTRSSTPASSVCPPPVWMDLCTVKWLASTPKPAFAQQCDRLQNLLKDNQGIHFSP